MPRFSRYRTKWPASRWSRSTTRSFWLSFQVIRSRDAKRIAADDLDAGDSLLFPVRHCFSDQVLGACTEFSGRRRPAARQLAETLRSMAASGLGDGGAEHRGHERHDRRSWKPCRLRRRGRTGGSRSHGANGEARTRPSAVRKPSRPSRAWSRRSSCTAARSSRSARAVEPPVAARERHRLARHRGRLRRVARLQLELAELEP